MNNSNAIRNRLKYRSSDININRYEMNKPVLTF